MYSGRHAASMSLPAVDDAAAIYRRVHETRGEEDRLQCGTGPDRREKGVDGNLLHREAELQRVHSSGGCQVCKSLT